MGRCFKKWTHETGKKDGSIEPCTAENDESIPFYRFYIYISMPCLNQQAAVTEICLMSPWVASTNNREMAWSPVETGQY